MKKTVIDKLQAYVLIQQSKGKMFSGTFIKKDETVRKINCRTGVKKGLTGTGLKYNAHFKKLYPVYDVTKKDYRMINLDTLTSLNMNKNEYIVRG